MSDGSRRRIKLRVGKPGSQANSQQPSRAGSPTVIEPDARSRPASPGNIRSNPRFVFKSFISIGARRCSIGDRALTNILPDLIPPFPTAAELKARIPPEGTTISELLKVFRKAIAGKERGARFTDMLRTVSRYDKGSKILFPN